MATAIYPAYRSPGAARVRLLPDGTAIVASATQDIGTGTYTTMTQVAADALGIPPERITAQLGDSTFPPAPMSGGSMTTASVTPAVKAAAEDALRKVIRCALEDENSPFHGMAEDRLIAENGRVSVVGGSRSVSYAEVLKSRNVSMIEGEAHVAPGDEAKKYAFHSFGAQFSEVRVDSETGEVRVTRHVGVFDIGRVINQKTARSQALSGITFGIGMALLENTVYDKKHGRVVANNLADYAVPVNADILNIDVAFIDQPDFISNSVGGRGLGRSGLPALRPLSETPSIMPQDCECAICRSRRTSCWELQRNIRHTTAFPTPVSCSMRRTAILWRCRAAVGR